ncbi:MAG TPA: class I SAM-dependent methyltransferase [Candidatus Cloacimonetes bacterium]|nr:class I SAM-dependent methyltransferase [Candidatus Cloacimonadota bacterium]
MAIPIINNWRNYYPDPDEGMGSSYERIILNRLLLRLYDQQEYESALEAPCFGFTGISGINLVALAQKGCMIYLEDHDAERIELIKESWSKLSDNMEIMQNTSGYSELNFPDNSVDLVFNFSAMWFVQNLLAFISEACRISKKDILICLPNREGLGFKDQLKGYSKERYPQLYPAHINPESLIYLMKKKGWELIESDYIDCPPWPDIGMNKEDFIHEKFGIKLPESEKPKEKLSILPYYQGEDPDFEMRMMRLFPFERTMPQWFKRIWAHHRYFLFRA